ncbi:MAG: hypothetical protein ACFFDN_48680 [Candidatus Hodarchaeota archaeon]
MCIPRPAVSQIPSNISGDGLIFMTYLNIILTSRNTPAEGPDDLSDLDDDGMITALDARKLVIICTYPRCECK